MRNSPLEEAKERLQFELRQVKRIIKSAPSDSTISQHAKIKKEIIVFLLDQPDDEIVSLVASCKQQYQQSPQWKTCV